MGNVQGDLYERVKKIGPNPYTRSGISPPKILKKAGSDEPTHRLYEPMSLELHMADERVRTSGLTPAEREWRHKWIKDQHLHPDEPIHVDAVHRQLNPIRVFYRWPWDKLYVHFLYPSFGAYYGTLIRLVIPKAIITFILLDLIYYSWKYEEVDWQRQRGLAWQSKFRPINVDQDFYKDNKQLIYMARPDPAKYGGLDSRFVNRTQLLDIGETQRPW